MRRYSTLPATILAAALPIAATACQSTTASLETRGDTFAEVTLLFES